MSRMDLEDYAWALTTEMQSCCQHARTRAPLDGADGGGWAPSGNGQSGALQSTPSRNSRAVRHAAFRRPLGSVNTNTAAALASAGSNGARTPVRSKEAASDGSSGEGRRRLGDASDTQNDTAMVLPSLHMSAEFDALTDLFYAFGGPSWVHSGGWLQGPPCVNTTTSLWFGVVCQKGRVVTLHLMANNLTGEPHTALNFTKLSSLSELSILNLRGNFLSGPLPEYIAQMPGLTVMDLQSNAFFGTLPDAWSAWTRGSLLVLSDNYLYGTLPSAWHSLRSLTYLSLSHNNLTGTLPETWLQMEQLTYIDFSNNTFTMTTSSLWLLPNIVHLDVHRNRLSGEFRFPAGQRLYENAFETLSYLNLAENPGITGTLPMCSYAGTGGAAVYLNFSHTGLSGPLPPLWNLCFPFLSSLEIRGTHMVIDDAIRNGTSFVVLSEIPSVNRTLCPILQANTDVVPISVSADNSFYGIDFCPCDNQAYGLCERCHSCEWAFSNCTGLGLLLLPGVWASNDNYVNHSEHELHFARCPHGRCCIEQPKGCNVSAVCSGANREGVLCGACLPGFSAPWSGDSCQPNGSCWAGALVTATLFVVAMLYVTFLVVKSSNGVLYSEPVQPKGWRRVGTTEGAVVVLGFFYQVAPLIVSWTTKQNLHVLGRFFLSVFGLTLSSSGGICLFADMSDMSARLFNLVFPAFLLVCLGTVSIVAHRHSVKRMVPSEGRNSDGVDRLRSDDCHGSHEVVQTAGPEPTSTPGCGSKTAADGEAEAFPPWSEPARCMHALDVVVGLAYMTVLNTTASFLRCVEIVDGSGKPSLRLFYYGEQQCWSGWQAGPLVVTLVLALFPIYRMYIGMRHTNTFTWAVTGRDRRLCRQNCQWWVGSLLLQRLAFVAVETFFVNELLLAWLNALVAAACLLVVVAVRPYSVPALNAVDGVARSILVVLSWAPIGEAELIETGTSIDTPQASVLKGLQYVTTVLLILPGLWYMLAFLLDLLAIIRRYYRKRVFSGVTVRTHLAPLLEDEGTDGDRGVGMTPLLSSKRGSVYNRLSPD